MYPNNGLNNKRGRVVGERIKEMRESRDMSRSTLRKRTGVRTTENIKSWENGGAPRDVVIVDEMARALDVSTAYLFGETDNPGNYDGPLELARIITGYYSREKKEPAAVEELATADRGSKAYNK
jgi:transcriptional regulator with XRE-family HTH domain